MDKAFHHKKLFIAPSDGLLGCINASLGAERRRGWKERRTLLLFNPLWDGVGGNKYHIAKGNKIVFSLSLTPCITIL
jgi:hypothetical protein